jgi:hypothetical protein
MHDMPKAAQSAAVLVALRHVALRYGVTVA